MKTIKNIFHFIRYDNGAILLLFILFGGAGTIWAAGEVVGGAVAAVSEEAVDTTVLLSADLDSFDFALVVTGAEESEDSYAVGYTMRTLSIVDNRWQETEKPGMLTVAKSALGSSDLHAYVLKQLEEVVAAERTYLAKAQSYEQSDSANRSILTGFRNMSLDSLAQEAEEARPEFVPQETEEEMTNDETEEIVVEDEVVAEAAEPTADNNASTTPATESEASTTPAVIETEETATVEPPESAATTSEAGLLEGEASEETGPLL